MIKESSIWYERIEYWSKASKWSVISLAFEWHRKHKETETNQSKQSACKNKNKQHMFHLFGIN